jgi:hypothetical protein
MTIEGGADSLKLRPINPENGFMFGNRGGAAAPRTTATFWPLRLLNGEDGAEVLEAVEKLWAAGRAR